MNEQRCVCGAWFVQRMHWASGKPAPITVETFPDGNVAVREDGSYEIVPAGERAGRRLHKNHFADCAEASRFKRRTS